MTTGYGDQRPRRRAEKPFTSRPRAVEEPSRSLREPAGEPRVSRVRRGADFDVPEFIPRR